MSPALSAAVSPGLASFPRNGETLRCFLCAGWFFSFFRVSYGAAHRSSMIPELFKIILPRITPRVLEVIHNHLTDEQIGLLLVKLINPYVVLSQQEEAMLRGVNRKTLRGMKARGEVAAHRSSALGVNLGEDSKFPQKGLTRPKNIQNRCKKRASTGRTWFCSINQTRK